MHADVPFQRIMQADTEPQNWMTYSRNYTGQRFSPLSELNASNVKDLKVQWAYQMPDPNNETSPLVVDGIMYFTAAELRDRARCANRTVAVDLESADAAGLPSHAVRRRPTAGPHLLGDTLYVTDARLLSGRSRYQERRSALGHQGRGLLAWVTG